MEPSEGRPVAIVTGASSGIGEATAKGLAARGLRVILPCRDRARGEAAAARIRAAVPSADLALEEVDLGALASVRACVDRLRTLPRIDVLVLNAGTTTRARELTADGFERTLAVDVLGHFALTVPLLPALRAAAPSRIVTLAGIYHRKGAIDLDDLHFARRAWTMRAANDQAQLARVVIAFELARRLRDLGVTSNAVHPGAVITEAQRDAPAWARLLIHTVARPFFVLPDRGAAPVVRLAVDPALEGVTGRYFDRAREAPAHPLASDPDFGRALFARFAELTGLDAPREA